MVVVEGNSKVEVVVDSRHSTIIRRYSSSG